MGGASMQVTGYGVLRRLHTPTPLAMRLQDQTGSWLQLYLPSLCVLSLASAAAASNLWLLPSQACCPRPPSTMAFHGTGAAQSAADEATALATALAYHDRTKHAFNKYAQGPGGLDWRNQPNPFRRYQGAEMVPLEHLPPDPLGIADPPYPDAFVPGKVQSKQLSKRTLSQLLYDSVALSAWKKAGASVWSLRVNPSSGNLHPTESYIVSGPVQGVCDEPFVAHYAPKEHALEIRARLPEDVWRIMAQGRDSGTLFVAFTSIFWREAWKYGERGFRYCNHDVGHAIGAVEVAAEGLGWKSRLLDDWEAPQLQALFGLPDPKPVQSDGHVRGMFPELEEEHPDCLLVVSPRSVHSESGAASHGVPSLSERGRALAVAARMREVDFKGTPNALSKQHVRWGVIYRVAAATQKITAEHGDGASNSREDESDAGSPAEVPARVDPSIYEPFTFREVVRKRRSAVDMDPQYGMQRDVFFEVLRKAMPAPGGDVDLQRQVPFGPLPWDPEIHMVIFVHRVVRLPPGIYILVRNAKHKEALKREFRAEFEWEKPQECPKDLPFYSLMVGDCKLLAARISCQQEIAGDSCFSLGMLARFEPVLKERGAWMYPRLFWESGLLGQLLYLEAHAVGISATGIGCYFDDPMHELLGIKSKQFQSLYHFTVGIPVVDTRIMSLPAYPGPPQVDA